MNLKLTLRLKTGQFSSTAIHIKAWMTNYTPQKTMDSNYLYMPLSNFNWHLDWKLDHHWNSGMND